MLPSLPRSLRYTCDHLWVKVEGTRAVVGITPVLAKDTGNLYCFTLPGRGEALEADRPLGRVRGSAAEFDLPSPVTGEVEAVNDELSADPALAEEDPFGEGWLVRLSLDRPEDADALMSAEEYREYIAGLERAE
jgi:glycine cleavage system H protein